MKHITMTTDNRPIMENFEGPSTRLRGAASALPDHVQPMMSLKPVDYDISLGIVRISIAKNW